MKMFTIMLSPEYRDGGTIAIVRKAGSPFVAVAAPWDMMMEHEKQALQNHSQTIQRLNERGGLSACEAVAVLEDREYRRMAESVANYELCRYINNYLAGIPSSSIPQKGL